MTRRRRERGRALIAREALQPFLPLSSTLTLRVPARPEALGIVRLVLMSCGAAGGVELEEIFSRSHAVANAFTNILVHQPEATAIVMRIDSGAAEVDLVSLQAPEE
jgi:hypothetical protein